MHVLFVDDEKNTRDVYAQLIAHAGHDVVAAESAAAAVRAVDGGSFDVAFVDLVLGDGDGIDVVRHLKQRQPAARAVLITAYHVADAAARARAAHAEALLSKPVKWEDLARFLQSPVVPAGESR